MRTLEKNESRAADVVGKADGKPRGKKKAHAKGKAGAGLGSIAISRLNARARAKAAREGRQGKRRKPKVGEQLVLARTAGHGGKRKGAGRKKNEGRRNVPHRTRARLGKKTPVHVTLRMRAGRASLRAEVLRNIFERIVRQTRCEDFHVAVYSLQHDHVHMICEPEDRRALSAGIRRIAIRFSLRMNALFGSTHGKNWGDRYHRHDLKTPREVRNALAYVLMNAKKHGICRQGDRFIDPYSSSAENDVWEDVRIRAGEARVCHAPRFWLLGVGWKRDGGLLKSTDRPAGAAPIKGARRGPAIALRRSGGTRSRVCSSPRPDPRARAG